MGQMERVQGEMTETGGQLGRWKTSVKEASWNLWKWFQCWLLVMEFDKDSQLAGLGCIQFLCYQGGYHWNPQTTQVVSKLLSGKWQWDSFAIYNTHSVPKTWKNRAGSYMQPSSLCSSIFDAERYSAVYWRRNMDTNQPLIYSLYVLPENYAGGTEFVGVANQYLVWLKTHPLRRNPYLALLGQPKSWD